MTLKSRRVLVTGGAGFIGSHLVDRIADEDPEILVVVDNFFLGKDANLSAASGKLGPRLIIERRSCADLSAMTEIVQRHAVQDVFNLAVLPLPASLSDPVSNVTENVGIALVGAELARLEKIERLIHFSSSETYGTAAYVPIDEQHPYVPSTPYAASKVAGDQVVLSYVHTFGIKAAVLRPFNNYGPRQNAGAYAGIIPIVVNRVRAGQAIEIFGDGEQTRDLLFVRDTVNATVRLREAGDAALGRVYNVASQQEIRIVDLVAMLLEILNVPNHPVEFCPARPGDVRRHLGSSARAKEQFEFCVETDLRDGLSETVDWYLSQTRDTR